MRELVEPVPLCVAGARLNPEAIGWSRTPVVAVNLEGPVGRRKRWDYWCVQGDDYAFALVHASLDYLGIAAISFLDRTTGDAVEHSFVVPGGLGFPAPGEEPSLVVKVPGVSFAVSSDRTGTTIVADGTLPGRPRIKAELRVELPAGHEAIHVVVPWSDTRFQYNVKHGARPVIGAIHVGERVVRIGRGDAFGCLDRGRGVWPARVRWNWSHASGRIGARTLAVNLGGAWTDGTGATENGLILDGRVHKIDEDLRWNYDRESRLAPWSIVAESGRVDVRLRPQQRVVRGALVGGIGAKLVQVWGWLEGTVVTDEGETIRVDGLRGWAEEFRGTW